MIQTECKINLESICLTF